MWKKKNRTGNERYLNIFEIELPFKTNLKIKNCTHDAEERNSERI